MTVGRLSATALLIVSAACSETETASSESETRESTAEVEAPTRVEEEPSDEPSPIKAVDHRSLRASVAEARRVAGRDPDAGYRAFVALIEEHPAQARLYCEAGFLAHRAGKNDEAAMLIRRGLQRFGDTDSVPTELRNPVAACLYNEGLVSEARGRIDRARRSYRRSLSLRPNATVERRMASLADPPPQVIPVHDHEALEEALAERLRDDPSNVANVTDPDGSMFTVREMSRVELPDDQPDVAVLKTDHVFDHGFPPAHATGTSVDVAVITDEGYRLFPIFEDVDWGHDTNELTSLGDADIEVITTRAGPVVRVTLTVTFEDGSESCSDACCYEWSSHVEREIVALCTVDGPACRHLVLASTERRTETVVDCDDDEESEDEESAEPERTSEAWRRTLSIDPDRTTHLRVESGEPPSHPAPGDRPLDDLMNLSR